MLFQLEFSVSSPLCFPTLSPVLSFSHCFERGGGTVGVDIKNKAVQEGRRSTNNLKS